MAIGANNTVHSADNTNQTSRNDMLEMWRESIQTVRQNSETTVRTAASEQEARAELEQRIRNGQEPCPACEARAFVDDSDDTGVSFQAARHIPQAIAGVVVMAHEGEHVSANRSETEEGIEAYSRVTLEYAICATCGRRYVAGGATRTNFRPESLNDRAQYFMNVDMLI